MARNLKLPEEKPTWVSTESPKAEKADFRYKITHGFKIPTVQYGSEEFYYSIQGDTLEEVVSDLKKAKALFPPITRKQKIEAATKPTKETS